MTKIKAETNARRAANFGFAALLFILFGWANLEVFLLSANTGIRGQLLTNVFGVYLSILAYRRCQSWRASLMLPGPESGLRFPSKARDVASIVALAMAGFVLSYFMWSDFVTPTAVGAAAFMFIPWFRSRFCQEYFYISHASLVAGGLPMLIICAKDLSLIILLAHTWVLWTLAAGLVLSALWLQRSAIPPPSQLQPEPKACGAGVQ